jgi:hypothetical protein
MYLVNKIITRADFVVLLTPLKVFNILTRAVIRPCNKPARVVCRILSNLSLRVITNRTGHPQFPRV